MEKSKLIGIFHGKKTLYNKLILKSLAYGPKTTRQIATYIYQNRGLPTKEVNINKVKNIESNICRKNGGIPELDKKNYIFKEDRLWKLELKGLSIALTQFPNIMEVFPYLQLDSVLEPLQKQLYETPLYQLMFETIFKKEIANEVFAFGKSQEFPQLLKDFTNELITQGVNLDKIENDNFLAMLISKLFQVLPVMIANKFKSKEK